MTNAIRAIFGTLAVGLLAVLMLPLFASAQTSSAQLIVVTQTNNVYFGNTPSILVSVTGNGPSLSSSPSSVGTLSYTSNFTNDTRVITLNPGSYSVTAPNSYTYGTANNYSFSYGSNCNGTIIAGETRYCTITANSQNSNGYYGNNNGYYGYGNGVGYVNVNTTVQNTRGGTRSASDFVISVSGQNPSITTLQGSVGSTQVSMGAGSFSINVSTTNGYTVTRSEGCSGTLLSGESKSCFITLSDVNNYNNNYYNGTYYQNGYNSNPTNTLSCTPSNQTVYRNQTVSFNATGGTGTYSWATADRTSLNIGPILNTRLLSTGDQAVYVTSGYQTATCLVTVLSSKGTVYDTQATQVTQSGIVYTGTNTFYTGTTPSGIVLSSHTVALGLPNTGFAPNVYSMLLALFAAFVALPFAVVALYPHAKRTASSFLS